MTGWFWWSKFYNKEDLKITKATKFYKVINLFTLWENFCNEGENWFEFDINFHPKKEVTNDFDTLHWHYMSKMNIQRTFFEQLYAYRYIFVSQVEHGILLSIQYLGAWEPPLLQSCLAWACTAGPRCSCQHSLGSWWTCPSLPGIYLKSRKIVSWQAVFQNWNIMAIILVV